MRRGFVTKSEQLPNEGSPVRFRCYVYMLSVQLDISTKEKAVKWKLFVKNERYGFHTTALTLSVVCSRPLCPYKQVFALVALDLSRLSEIKLEGSE